MNPLDTLLTEFGCPDYSLWAKPPKVEYGDFALPCFRYAKDMGMNPKEFGDKFGAFCKEKGFIEDAVFVGGFLNLKLTAEYLASSILEPIFSGEVFHHPIQNKKIMVEHSQPNTHKSFHVGHLRNVCLGDSIVRMLRYLGNEVTSVNYPGDEGTHIAKCLWQLKLEEAIPDTKRGEWLGEVYTRATKRLSGASDEEKEKYNREIAHILANLESKKGDDYEKWQETRSWSLEAFYEIYDWLGVKFDHYFFESELSEKSQQIVDEFLKKGVFVESDGAIGCDLEEEKLGFLIARKKDGNTLYATKDLALARDKFENFQIEKSVYVVGSEQNFHFKQVFATLKKMGFKNADHCHHLSYGHVRLPEGKMSSRDGSIVKFSELKENVVETLGEYLRTDDEESKKRLSVAAIKFGMLATDPQKDVVYNAKDWVSFEGQSGPYLLYSYARSNSVLKKAGDLGNQFTGYGSLDHPSERELIRAIYDFREVVESACQSYRPSSLAHYLYDTSKLFNRFYSHCPILKEEVDPKTAASRLKLVEAFSKLLSFGLALLGIETVDEM